jgi:ribosome-binding factor A
VPKDFSRKSRIDVQLQRELTGLIRDELTDPRVTNVTVTRVDVSPDLRNARVLISVLGDDSRIGDAATALNHAAGRLRHGLGVRTRLRYVPQLHFAGDVQLIEASRLNHLIRDARREDDSRARERAPEEPEGSDGGAA